MPSKFQKKGEDYQNMSALDLIKYLAHHRGSTGRQVKNMAMRWLGKNHEKEKNENMGRIKQSAEAGN